MCIRGNNQRKWNPKKELLVSLCPCQDAYYDTVTSIQQIATFHANPILVTQDIWQVKIDGMLGVQFLLLIMICFDLGNNFIRACHIGGGQKLCTSRVVLPITGSILSECSLFCLLPNNFPHFSQCISALFANRESDMRHTVEPHFNEHPRDQGFLFVGVRSVRSPGFTLQLPLWG